MMTLLVVTLPGISSLQEQFIGQPTPLFRDHLTLEFQEVSRYDGIGR